ncbi:MAG TPA: hypothetical protein PLH03_06930 [Methylophilaceae bacterium]|nr:hypothetical protein [Methylophilaceae bacterium]
MKNSATHLDKLKSLVTRFDSESGDVVIGKMLPELGALIVTLIKKLNSAQQKFVRLTWALFWLTLFLAVVGVAQLAVAFNPPQIQISNEVKNGEQQANSAHRESQVNKLPRPAHAVEPSAPEGRSAGKPAPRP